jgi:hypothetical protein
MGLIAVVMGAESSKDRFAACKSMLDYGFANYALVDPQVTEGEVAVKLGKQDMVKAVPAEPVQPAEPETPAPVPPEQAQVTDTKLTCTLEIRCDKLVGNAELDPDKVELVPEDGSLFLVTDVVFFEGESVFNVLQRTMKQNKQHLEFVQTPLYNSAYIEGICNLYAYDAGDLSGWMYSVNGAFPNYGCSQYVVQAGDVIVWHYTCDLGADLGAENASGNNQ